MLGSRPHRPWYRRAFVWLAVIVVATLSVLAALVALPLSTTAHELVVSWTGSSVNARSTVALEVQWPTVVSVHFTMPAGGPMMSYWVRGPGAMGGMGNGHMGMGARGESTYTFWTWGGQYEIGAGDPVYTCPLECPGGGSVVVWANVTDGWL